MSFREELLSNPTQLFSLIEYCIDGPQLGDQLPAVMLPQGWHLVDHDYCKTSVTPATTSVFECRKGSSVESEDSTGDQDVIPLTSPSPPPSTLRMTEEDSDTSTLSSISSPEASIMSSCDDSPCSLTSSVEGEVDDDEVVFICERVFTEPPEYRKGTVVNCRVAKALCPSDCEDGDSAGNGLPSPSFSEASTLGSDDSGSAFEVIDLISPPPTPPPPSSPSPPPPPKTSDKSDQLPKKRKVEVKSFESLSAKRVRKPKIWCTHPNWRREIAKYEKCVDLKKSHIESNGIFCVSPIPSGVCIMEYLGQRIASKLVEGRERNYVKKGIIHDYMFRIDEDVTIDATKPFSLGKYVNHSCEPNTRSSIMVIRDVPRVFIVAIRDIKVGEELSMDYCFPEEPDPAKRVPCLCGSANCRGFLN